MNSNRILWVIVILAIMVWEGVGFYWYFSSRVTTGPSQSSPTTEAPIITPQSFEHTLPQSPSESMASQLFTLNYKGYLKEKKSNQWTLVSGENELSFTISEKTDFFKMTKGIVKEPIKESEIKKGDYLIAVNLGVWIGEVNQESPQDLNTLQNYPVSEVWLSTAQTQ